MDRLRVGLGENSYDIVFSGSFDNLIPELEKINTPKKLLIVTDTNVEQLYSEKLKNLLNTEGYDAAVYAFEAGEENKGMDTILGICEACINHGMDRKSRIIALGGGVVGDMAGFAAAIYMRGIDFVQVPTTLLSQSDSSVGGKTGIDFKSYKNILGAFHQPKLVYINVNTLKSLPQKQIVSGMGEVIKHGIIRDSNFFDYLYENKSSVLKLDEKTLIDLSKKNCSIKADVVSKDEKENGLRAILNFGHTIGHAIESAFDFTLTHGECVGIGMIAVCHIAYNRGNISKEMLSKVEAILDMYGFKTKLALPPAEVICEHMQKDKKKSNGKLKFILPVKIGEVEQVTDVSEKEIISALNYISEA